MREKWSRPSENIIKNIKKLKTKNQVKTNQLKEYGRTIIGRDAKTKSTAVLKTLCSGDGKILHQCHSHPLLPVCAAGWNLYAPGSLDRHGASALEAQLHSDHSVAWLSTFKCPPQKNKTLPTSRLAHKSIADLRRIGLLEMATFTALNCCWKLQLAH